MITLERATDLEIRHQVSVQRYATGVTRALLPLLHDTELRVVALFVEAPLPAVLTQVAQFMSDAWMNIGLQLREIVNELVAEEIVFQTKLSEELKVDQYFFTDVLFTPYVGRTWDEWLQGLGQASYERIRDAVRMSAVAGEAWPKLYTRLKGTREFRYTDGVFNRNVVNLEGFVRTTFTHAMTRSRQQLFENNDIKQVQWLSVLDVRSSVGCGALHGKVFPIDKGPRGPIHWNCRSTIVQYFKDRSLLSFDAWIRQQPISIQEEVLGKEKARLLRENDLSVARFVNRLGSELTLEQLRSRDREIY